MVLNRPKALSHFNTPVFFLSFDQGYLIPASAAIVSLIKNHPNQTLKIYLLVNENDHEWIMPLVQMIEKLGAEAVIKTVPDRLFLNLKLNLHFTSATYYRLLAGELFDESRIIYLDSDVIVNGSLLDLWELDFQDFPLAAIADPLINDFQRLDLNPSEGYFNSGVMVLNLDRWREIDLGNQVLSFIQKFPEKIKYADQCGLNAVLKGNWKRLAPKWNVQSSLVENRSTKDCEKYFSKDELKDSDIDPRIIHFTGVTKPWNLGSRHPKKQLFWNYLDQTTFKTRLPLNFSLINLAKSLFPYSVKKYYWRYLNRNQSS